MYEFTAVQARSLEMAVRERIHQLTNVDGLGLPTQSELTTLRATLAVLIAEETV